MHRNFIKKAASLAASLSVALTAVPSGSSAEREILGYMGDVNHDMAVNAADLVALQEALLGIAPLPEGGAYNADMDHDGTVDSLDLVLLRRYVLGTLELEPIYGEEIPDETTTTSAETTTTTTITDWYEETTTTTTTVWYEETTSATTTTTIIYTDPETTTTTASASFIKPAVEQVKAYLPSQDDANLVIFYVDFPDCKYDYAPSADEIDEIAFGAEDTSDANYPFDSMSAFYSRSSKGAMKLSGKAFRYTTKNPQSYYNENKFLITQECYEAFKDSEDFSRFDGDGDGYIDATLFSVPTKAGDDYWWPCAGPVDQPQYTVDGVKVGHIITGNAQIESVNNYKNFNSSYLHEMGHCMGLPDYYLFNDYDSEGMHGTGGYELMDTDASSDFGAVSKLQLGWYKEDQVQVYDSSKGTQTFTLSNAQKDGGNCVLIPSPSYSGYNSEYFLIEYATKDRNNSSPMWGTPGEGVRVYHVEGTLVDFTDISGSWKSYCYGSGAPATKNDAGRRFIRIIDDTNTDNLYKTGDIISSSISGFNWYDSNDNMTIDPGVTITVGEKSGDEYTITIQAK